MPSLPTGVITFLFTDIEGSTTRWEHYPEAMRAALERHDEILRQTIEGHAGIVFQKPGDAFCAAFVNGVDALAAALEAQHKLFAEDWGGIGQLRVRMALHTEHAERYEDSYVSVPLNRVARMLSAAHGGQVLISEVTYSMVRESLSDDMTCSDMGEHYLKDLRHPMRMFQISRGGLPQQFPPLNTISRREPRLPIQSTPFIGREQEIVTLSELLRRPEVRLVTLTGPGGIGKTRLAIECAAQLASEFKHGIYFVPLAPISDATLVLPTLAKTLGIREEPHQTPFEIVQHYVEDKSLLLVLDNFEQVVTSAALLTDLLSSAPGLKLLVTSREVLHLRGEHVTPVSTLTLPSGKQQLGPAQLLGYDAIKLFVKRAQEAAPLFQLDSENARAVAEICRQLDGLPLAIELAAARVKLFPPKNLSAMLKRRLQLLTGGARDLPTRQQTLHNTITWSYDLLNHAEQHLFACLAVFPQSWSLEAAIAIAGESLATIMGMAGLGAEDLLVSDSLSALLDKSLVHMTVGVDNEQRYLMLGTIRDYALERFAALDDNGALDQRYAAYHLNFIETAARELAGPNHPHWQARLKEDFENVRLAIHWLMSHGAEEQLVRFFENADVVIRLFFSYGDTDEQLQWFNMALAREQEVPPKTRAKALALLGEGLFAYSAQWERATAYLEESIELARRIKEKQILFKALVLLGCVFSERGQQDRASEIFRDIERLLPEADSQDSLYEQVMFLGSMALREDRMDVARSIYEQGRALGRRQGNFSIVAWCTMGLGWITRGEGQLTLAADFLEEATELYRHLQDEYHLMVAQCDLGTVLLYQNNLQRARQLLAEAMEFFYEHKVVRTTLICLERLGQIDYKQGLLERAAALWGAVETLRKQYGLGALPEEHDLYQAVFDATRSSLGAARWRQCWQEGQQMSIEQALARVTEPPSESP